MEAQTATQNFSASRESLLAQPYELARFNTVTVHIDYHVEIDKHRYSLPHALVGQGHLWFRAVPANMLLETEMLGHASSASCHDAEPA
ncbi:hypothetical protein BN2476_1000004 [Paraburkholderia piptadeniae]|uniref:Transposase for insertion sequence element IS21-like C-terminal domain-containing protein n=1 Tax=Paraburkholderia piptadeniae TaxID=1701573 RepID=A0A1N7SUE7_9BURK|nr:hypothetical protein BN2476_1000004 [Paraburkholderia piptadeniae]